MELNSLLSKGCEHSKVIDDLKKIIAIDCSLNIIKIDCAHALLRWSASPDVCIKRHNILISSLSSSIMVSRVANVKLISSDISNQELMHTITELTIKKPLLCINSGNYSILREEELSLYHELASSQGKIGKYRSNKKKRMMDRFGLRGDYEYVLFFNLIHSMPYQLLRVQFIKDSKNNLKEMNATNTNCKTLACNFLNVNVTRKSFLLCATMRCQMK